MSHQLLDYPNRLRREGFRVTPQRQLILDAICRAGRHVSTERIIRDVQSKTPGLNRATIYRNLIFLQERRLVVSAQIGGETVYEIAQLTPHHHLVCRLCGAEADLDPAAVAHLFDAIHRRTGFRADEDHLTLTGICSHCQNTSSSTGKTKIKRPIS